MNQQEINEESTTPRPGGWKRSWGTLWPSVRACASTALGNAAAGVVIGGASASRARSRRHSPAAPPTFSRPLLGRLFSSDTDTGIPGAYQLKVAGGAFTAAAGMALDAGRCSG